jgi:hypothetical protein
MGISQMTNGMTEATEQERATGALIEATAERDFVSDLISFAESIPPSATNGQPLPCALSRLEIRSAILDLQRQMEAAQEAGEIAKVDINEILPLTHYFAPGMYGREITLKRFNWAIGKIHRHAHLNFVTRGKVIVLTEDGPMVITAPHTFISTVGTKRFVLALEDATWTTVHATCESDLEKIEAEVIAKDYSDIGIIENEVQKEKLL